MYFVKSSGPPPLCPVAATDVLLIEVEQGKRPCGSKYIAQ